MLMLVSVRRETDRIDAPSQSMARILARVAMVELVHDSHYMNFYA